MASSICLAVSVRAPGLCKSLTLFRTAGGWGHPCRLRRGHPRPQRSAARCTSRAGSWGRPQLIAARFDPVTTTWNEIAPMPVGRNHAASASGGSSLWVIGGRGAGSGDNNSVANGFDTVQVYDPSTDVWRSSEQPSSGLTPLPQPRGGMGKAVFVEGELYVMGGETVTGTGATSANVYARVDIVDPASGNLRQGAPMLTPRHGIFPVAIGKQITVAGGGVKSGSSSSSVTQTYTVTRPN